MNNFRALMTAAVFCGGGLLLAGCHQQEAGPGGIPMPAPHAAPPPQAQIQEIENNPHIPPAQKAALEAQIKNGTGVSPPPAPSQTP